MNVVFLSPHFPPNFVHFCRALRDCGATVLGIGDAPYESLAPPLRETLAHYVYVADLHDYDAMLRAMGFLIHRFGRIDRIDSLNEYWLGLEARLREDFNIFGQKTTDLARNRVKSGMKAAFQTAGIPCARGCLLSDAEGVRALAAECGYPLVCKPDIGVGARGVFKLHSVADVERVLADPPPEPYLVEEYIRGQLVSYDGILDREGNIVVEIPTRVSLPIAEIVSGEGNGDADGGPAPMHYYTRREIPADMREIGRNVLKILNIRERFFHIEMFELPDKRHLVLEINVRPPGGYSTDMMNFTADIDMFRLWAEILVNGKPPAGFTYERKYHVVHVARRDHVRYESDRAELYRLLGSGLDKGSDGADGQGIVMDLRMPAAFAAVMGDEMIMARFFDEERLKEAVRLIEARVK